VTDRRASTPSLPDLLSPIDRERVRERVDAALTELMDAQLAGMGFLGGDLPPVVEALRTFVLDGGKRIRPAFVYWGFRGAGGAGDGAAGDAVVRASCAVELLHACALIHDDIMDASATRRGRPSVHVQFAQVHRAAGWRGNPDAFGEGAAILMGDLALTWADAGLARSGLAPDRVVEALAVFNVLRSEMMGGQYLDMVESQRGTADEAAVQRVLRYKSGKYTVERPLHLGAAMAGGPHSAAVCVAYSAYGLPLGEAFQLRDDILGVFGAPEHTGKPAGDDLREGKETFLVVRARSLAGPGGRRVLDERLGDPRLDDAGVTQLRELIVDSGALAEAEARIARLTDQALAALDTELVEPDARVALADLARYLTDRRG
jgi:geranylgeranyl diphosphate synthase, type I